MGNSSLSFAPGLSLLPIAFTASPAAPFIRAAMVESGEPPVLLPQPRRVVNQGEVPCCVSCALGAAMEILYPDWPPLAALFHYYVTRFDKGRADGAGFLSLEDGLAVLEEQGICQFEMHKSAKFEPLTFAEPPSTDAYKDGSDRRLDRQLPKVPSYGKAEGSSPADEIRKRLGQGLPVVLAFRLPVDYRKFIASLKDKEWRWSDPESASPSETGHCVAVVGYSDAKLAFRIWDSLGKDFGQDGQWWMGYRVADSAFFQNAYYLERAPGR